MLLLGLAGVTNEDILANYQVSFTYIDTSIKLLQRVPMNLLDSKSEYLIQALDHLYHSYGDFSNYFTRFGFDVAKQGVLLQRIVEKHKP